MKIADLTRAARDIVLGLFNRTAWADIGMGMALVGFAGLYVVFRVACIVLFPVTVPLLAWARTPPNTDPHAYDHAVGLAMVLASAVGVIAAIKWVIS
jgi:hypothetical protein